MFIAEIKNLTKLAAPVSLAQLALVGMGATDVLIAGQAGTDELAGMNLGTNVWNMIILFFMGIGIATQALIANQYGAQSDRGVKHQFHQSSYMCLGLGVIGTVSVLIAAWAFSFASFEADLRLIAQRFLLVISLAAMPMCLLPAVRGTLEGISLTAVVFWINLAAFLLNIPLDYALVHGLWGFPKLGGVGCAWATVVLLWLMLFSACLVLKFHKKTRPKMMFSNFEKPHRETIADTFKLGLPIGLSVVIELSMFSGAGIMIASFGVIEAGAHAVAITIASMSFIFYLGLGQGVTIRASQFLGAKNSDAAWYTIKVGTILNVGLAALFCCLFLVFNQQFVAMFSNDPDVIKLAGILLIFGAVFQIPDCLQVAVICAMRAYRDTASPPKYQIFSFWLLGLPLGIGLAFYQWVPSLEGAKGMWVGMLLSLTLVAVFLLRRLKLLAVASNLKF